jgi:hypothetical protein
MGGQGGQAQGSDPGSIGTLWGAFEFHADLIPVVLRDAMAHHTRRAAPVHLDPEWKAQGQFFRRLQAHPHGRYVTDRGGNAALIFGDQQNLAPRPDPRFPSSIALVHSVTDRTLLAES